MFNNTSIEFVYAQQEIAADSLILQSTYWRWTVEKVQSCFYWTISLMDGCRTISAQLELKLGLGLSWAYQVILLLQISNLSSMAAVNTHLTPPPYNSAIKHWQWRGLYQFNQIFRIWQIVKILPAFYKALQITPLLICSEDLQIKIVYCVLFSPPSPVISWVDRVYKFLDR